MGILLFVLLACSGAIDGLTRTVPPQIRAYIFRDRNSTPTAMPVQFLGSDKLSPDVDRRASYMIVDLTDACRKSVVQC